MRGYLGRVVDPLQKSLDPGDYNTPITHTYTFMCNLDEYDNKKNQWGRADGSAVPVLGSSILCGAHLIQDVNS